MQYKVSRYEVGCYLQERQKSIFTVRFDAQQFRELKFSFDELIQDRFQSRQQTVVYRLAKDC